MQIGKQLWESPRDYIGKLPTTGKGVGVVVMDEGFDLRHPDFQGQIATTVSTSAADTFESNPVGHGSHVLGIIGANGASSAGQIQGAAPGAKLIPICVNVDPEASWEDASASFARAINWAVENKEQYNIRVINCSFVMPLIENVDPATGAVVSTIDPLGFAVDMATKAGISIVAGVGNSGTQGRITTPAGNSSVVAVGALDTAGTPTDPQDDRVAPFSSQGLSLDGQIKPDLVAPGVRIMSVNAPGSQFETTNLDNLKKARTVLQAPLDEVKKLAREQIEAGRLDPLVFKLPEDKFRRVVLRRFPVEPMEGKNDGHPAYIAEDGSSMAAPIVTAVIANMLEANPNLTPAEVKEILTSTARPLAQEAPEAQGHGALDAAAAVAEAARRVQP